MLRISDPIAVSVIAGGGAVSTVVDLYTRRIPNALTFGVAALGLLVAALGFGQLTAAQAFLGLVVGLLLMLPGHVIGATGAGDVKLMAAIGSFLGPGLVFRAFLYSALAGGVMALAIATRRGLLADTVLGTTRLVTSPAATRDAIMTPGRGNRFAYGPAIAAGTLIALVVHP